MSDPIPLTREEMLTRAARAIGRYDVWGPRGLTMITAEEMEACVCLLAALGLPPLGKDEAFDPPAALAALSITPLQTSLKGVL